MSWGLYSLGLRPLGLATAEDGVSSFSYTATGGLTFSGVAEVLRASIIQGSVGITFGGSSTQIREILKVGSGGITFAGAATLLFDPDGVQPRQFKRGRRPRVRII